MQASTATNETRLPRAVLKMSQALNDKYPVSETKTPDPAENVPPVEGQDPPGEHAATPADPKQQPPADPRESDPEYWKQRFKCTAGVLATERTDRKAQVLQFNQRLTELQERVAQLQAKPTNEPTDLGKYFTPEQVEELGEEECHARVAMIEKAVKDQLSAVIEREVKPLRDQREMQQVHDAQDRKAVFLDKLAELVPEYADIDTDQTFLSWLEQVNDDGIVRGDVLNKHVAAFNAPMVAKVFRDFMKTRTPAPQPPVTPHGSGAGGSNTSPQTSSHLRPPTDAEMRDYFKRAATRRKGQPGYVTDQERAEFEARLKLRAG